jgi:hypothetical protein
VWKSVVFDGGPDRRCYRSELVVGEVNCRHGAALLLYRSDRMTNEPPAPQSFADCQSPRAPER